METSPASPRPELPLRYYHDHAQIFLSSILENYALLLADDERAFIDAFQSLSLDGRCLYLRLTMRKPTLFRADKLAYGEIADIASTLAELAASGFIRPAELEDLQGEGVVASLFTRLELQQVLDTPHRGLKKEALVSAALGDHGVLRGLLQEHPIIVQAFLEPWEKLRILYFGSTDVSMEQFILRDLGQQRYEQRVEEQAAPAFRTREKFDLLLTAIHYHRTFREFSDAHSLSEHEEAEIAGFLDWNESHGRRLQGEALRRAGKAAIHLGKWLEKQQRFDQAIRCYSGTRRTPARERLVRLLDSRDPEAALSVALDMLDSPEGPVEGEFARDYLRRKREPGTFKRMTARLREAETIVLDPEHTGPTVEARSLSYFRAQGWEGMFAENTPWKNLLGLVIWEVIFDQNAGFHHPFQRIPTGLYDPEFPILHQAEIEAAIPICREAGFDRWLSARYAEKEGTVNPLVAWFPGALESMQRLVTSVPPPVLEKILHEMCRNLRSRTRGLPDLFLWRDGEWRLVEIKSARDQLSAEQLHWLDFFDQHQIPAQLVRVLELPGTSAG